MKYSWTQPDKINKENIDKFPELNNTIVQLLLNRGLNTQEKIDEFLYPEYSQDIHDPFLFSDMKKTVERIYQSIEKKELITIYGDYDADGVSSSTILFDVLTTLGAKVEVFLPHREKDGYGLNSKAVEELLKNNTKLIITVDCGISNTKEVDDVNNHNIDIIITDHHAIPETIPKAFSIIHPQLDTKYPFNYLAGVGVAFKLSQALLRSSKLTDKDKEIKEKWLLDMVSIATVADMVPLLGENRTLVKYGLIVLSKTKRIGLRKLIEVSNIDYSKIDTRSIGYGIAPRINAAGRMDHANLAFYLLTEEDEDRALELAIELNNSNLERQRITETMFRQALSLDIDLNDRLLIFFNKDWSSGLTGLVASKLLRKYNRPCLVITKNEENNHLVGSGRSIDQFNITKALTKIEKLLLRYGGHPQACGFSFTEDKLEEFSASIKKIAEEELKGKEFKPTLDIEIEIDFNDISWELVDLVDKFKPFGKDNEEPLFLSKNLILTNTKKVGKDEKHWKLEFMKDNKKIRGIGFGLTDIDLTVGNNVDIVYNLSINEWNGNRQIQLMIKDIKVN